MGLFGGHNDDLPVRMIPAVVKVGAFMASLIMCRDKEEGTMIEGTIVAVSEFRRIR